MREYTFTEARQNFASVLDKAKNEGAVCIKKRNGDSFYIKLAQTKISPLDIKGVNLGLSSLDIVDLIRECREREYS